MTDEQAIAKLEDLIDYIESLKQVTRLMVNGLLTPNKTEREYYKYREKKEWLNTQRTRLNDLRRRKKDGKSID